MREKFSSDLPLLRDFEKKVKWSIEHSISNTTAVLLFIYLFLKKLVLNTCKMLLKRGKTCNPNCATLAHWWFELKWLKKWLVGEGLRPPSVVLKAGSTSPRWAGPSLYQHILVTRDRKPCAEAAAWTNLVTSLTSYPTTPTLLFSQFFTNVLFLCLNGMWALCFGHCFGSPVCTKLVFLLLICLLST